jgi:hypothetical protein
MGKKPFCLYLSIDHVRWLDEKARDLGASRSALLDEMVEKAKEDADAA